MIVITKDDFSFEIPQVLP